MADDVRSSLGHELAAEFRIIVAALAVMMTVVVGLLAFSLASTVPNVRSAQRLTDDVENVHDDFLDEQSLVRAYLVSGTSDYIREYDAERAQASRDLASAGHDASGPLRPGISKLQADATAWTTGWADPSATPAVRRTLIDGSGLLLTTAVRTQIEAGMPTSTAYSDSQDATIAQARAALATAENLDDEVLGAAAGGLLLIGGTVTVLAFRRRRRWQRLLVDPVRAMLGDVRSVSRGEFSIGPVDSQLQELVDLSDGLADMATSLRLQQRALAGRAEQADRSAGRLRRVLGFAREMSASLTLPSVLDSIVQAALSLTGRRQGRVWLLDEDGTSLVLAFDSADPDAPARRIPSNSGAVGRAVTFSRTSYSVGQETGLLDGAVSYALPLVSSGRPVGALEIAVEAAGATLDSEVLEVLEAVAAHGATAIEAARLYEQTEHLSMSDALTGLANRRRLDEDLKLEAERAGRYGRSLAFLMIDVDHFKRINDEFGHATGDRVLHQLANLLNQHKRSVDTAYRYGGEELAILARETDLAGAARLAERLREGIERFFLVTDQRVTVSIGVATMPEQARTPQDLAAIADGALYRAKRGGRNRVMLATDALPAEVVQVDDLPGQPQVSLGDTPSGEPTPGGSRR